MRDGCAWLRCVLLAVACTVSVDAQRSGGSTVPDPSVMNGSGSRVGQGRDETDMGTESASMRMRRENALKTQRMDRMVASANRLLELTKQLQAGLSEHAALTPDDEKKLDEIAKAAREVKARMTQ